MRILTDPFGWFTVEVPEGWNYETEDGVTTMTSASGVGTAFLSGGRHARGRQKGFGGADFLARFLRTIGVEVDDAAIEDSEGRGCRVYSYRRESEGRSWWYWSVTDDETALLISYTCAAKDVGREAEDVDGLIRSVRLFHSPPVH